MSYNAGVIIGVKRTLVGGGVFSVTEITGPAHSMSRGFSAHSAPLDIWHPETNGRRFNNLPQGLMADVSLDCF